MRHRIVIKFNLAEIAPPVIANRIKEIRKSRGLTLMQLADAVGASNQQISHLENGRRTLSLEWLARLAKALRCAPLDLIEDKSIARTPDEHRLLSAFRKMPPLQREALLAQSGVTITNRASKKANSKKRSVR